MSSVPADGTTRPCPLAQRASKSTMQRNVALVERAPTHQWIESDTHRPGDVSVGSRSAGWCRRRMRRECPNDRRPTRSASAGRLTCIGAGRRRYSPAGRPSADGTESIGEPTIRTAPRRRRGSRGGRNRTQAGREPSTVDGERYRRRRRSMATNDDTFESDGQSTAATD